MAARISLSEVLPKLQATENRGSHWTALCPLHAEPVSLKLEEDEYGLRLKCAEGCRFDDIIRRVLPDRAFDGKIRTAEEMWGSNG